MTHKQFRDRLVKLIEVAHKSGLCPACVTRDLLIVSDAIVAASQMPAAVLEAHGMGDIGIGASDTHSPRTLQ